MVDQLSLPQLGRRATHAPSWKRRASSARSCSRTPCRRSSRVRAVRGAARARRVRALTARACAPTTAGSRWCGRFPERRAGIGLIYLNDIDAAIEEVRWIAKHGLRGGVLLPNVPPTEPDQAAPRSRVRPLWAVCQDLGVPMNHHGGTGSPDYGRHPRSRCPSRRDGLLLAAPARSCCSPVSSSASPPEARTSPSRLRVGAALLAHLDGMLERMRAPGARRDPVRAEDSLPPSAPSTSSRNVLDRRELTVAARRWRAATRPAPTSSSGAATTRTTRAPIRTRASRCGAPSTPCRRGGSARDARRERGEAVRLRPGRARAARRTVRADGRRTRPNHSTGCPPMPTRPCCAERRRTTGRPVSPR